MTKYTSINEAVDRINRAISALEADIQEWTMVKSTLFSKNQNRSQTDQEKELRSEFDSFLSRSQKVKENLILFRHLFDSVSVN